MLTYCYIPVRIWHQLLCFHEYFNESHHPGFSKRPIHEQSQTVMTCRLFISLLLILQVNIPAAYAAEVAAGPMVGVTAMRSARIWFQTAKPGSARVEYWPASRPESAPKARLRSDALTLQSSRQNAVTVTLNRLKPGTRYAYRVLVNGKAASPVLNFATQALWQWRTDPPDFRVVTGSCAYVNQPEYDRPGKPYGGGDEIFARMAAARPDLTVWLGDNVYLREADFDSPWGMAARYAHGRQHPPLQALLRTGSHAAIWDDHDFGPNDSNASFTFKDTALELFKTYWPNPSFGLADLKGVFTVVRQGDADFFLVDGRWYRDADMDKSGVKAMFGAAQMRWLKNALLNSTANFKIVTSGSQMLDAQSPYESWSNFTEERQGFIDWLTANKVNGVMFLSGDRHHTEMLQWPRSGSYTLHELTCSPLTAGPRDISKTPATPGQVPGTLVGERNFCTMDFSGPRTNRTLVIRSVATDGRELWKHSLSLSAMRTPKP